MTAPDDQQPEMPDDCMLGILVYDNGICLVQSKIEPEVAAQVLRDMAYALENGQPTTITLN